MWSQVLHMATGGDSQQPSDTRRARMVLGVSSPGKQNQLPALNPAGKGAEPRKQQDSDQKSPTPRWISHRNRVVLFLVEKEQRQSPGIIGKEFQVGQEQRLPPWGFTGTIKGSCPVQSASPGSLVVTATGLRIQASALWSRPPGPWLCACRFFLAPKSQNSLLSHELIGYPAENDVRKRPTKLWNSLGLQLLRSWIFHVCFCDFMHFHCS